jgi:hypothetical protein
VHDAGASGTPGNGRAPRRLSARFLALTAVAAGCGGGSDDKPKVNKPFCDAAGRYEKELERQFETTCRRREADRDRPDSPMPLKQIRPKADRFLDALQCGGGASSADDPDVREAVEDVNRYGAGLRRLHRRSGIYEPRDGRPPRWAAVVNECGGPTRDRSPPLATRQRDGDGQMHFVAA